MITAETAACPHFMFPATVAILLRERTWLTDVAITNWLRRYALAQEGEGFTVKSRQPGNHHYHVAATPGGFLVASGTLAALNAHIRTYTGHAAA